MFPGNIILQVLKMYVLLRGGVTCMYSSLCNTYN